MKWPQNLKKFQMSDLAFESLSQVQRGERAVAEPQGQYNMAAEWMENMKAAFVKLLLVTINFEGHSDFIYWYLAIW